MAVVPELVNTEGAEQYYAPERKSVKMDGLHYYGGRCRSLHARL